MDYSVFVKKALEKDKRNKFSTYEGPLDAIPEALKGFYRSYNPVDVELPYDGVSIRFFQAEDLTTLQEEYRPQKGEFIFATCNGDPIWYYDGKVYTGPHGTGDYKWEILSDTVEDFFLAIVA